MKQSTLFAVEKEPVQRLFDDFARGKTPSKRKRAAMASEEGRDMGAVIDALQGMTERLDALLSGNGGGKRSRSRREREDRDDGPESARETRGRGKGSGEIVEGILLPFKVPIGRDRGNVRGYVLVRNQEVLDALESGRTRRFDEAIEDLLQDNHWIDVWQPQAPRPQNNGGNGGNYNGGNRDYGNRDRGGYNERDRDYRR